MRRSDHASRPRIPLHPRISGGMTLMELIVALTLFLVVLGMVTAIGTRFETASRNLAEAMSDLQKAERFALDVKRDLARAESATVEPTRLRLALDGGETVYAFAAEEGTVTRTSASPAREYRYAFDGVSFEEDGGLVFVTVNLRKHDPESPTRARWRSAVLRPGRKE